jgi:DNA-binding NtrC family response regulator
MSLPHRASPQVCDVLVVEDDLAVLAFMAELLAEDGLEVGRASGGGEALAMLERDPLPAVLVTDINLAGEPDGLALARTVAERWPEIKLLIVSGECRPDHGEYPERAIFFTKPFASDALVAIVRSSDW